MGVLEINLAAAGVLGRCDERLRERERTEAISAYQATQIRLTRDRVLMHLAFLEADLREEAITQISMVVQHLGMDGGKPMARTNEPPRSQGRQGKKTPRY